MDNNTEAARLISEAFADVDVEAMEDCPMGEECGVHHRTDDSHLDDESQYGMIITYIGNYAVVTTDNPALESPSLLIRMMTGLIKDEDVPPMYQTTVYYVGDGVLWDMHEMGVKERLERVRYVTKHDEWATFSEEHDEVVYDVCAGNISLSKPVTEA